MGRETLLSLLLLVFGGLLMQPLTLLSRRPQRREAARVTERRAWLQLWLPVVPMLLVGAWLCGWALRAPDPVRTRFDHGILIGASLPFALVALRAALRAAWVLVRAPLELPICTIGLWRPRILFNPFLARSLDDEQIRAALEHERAHARHRDPVRIWLAQLATDLQWPWPWARDRFDAWLELLEHARDDEARSHGVSGSDLAAVVVATARHSLAIPRIHRDGRIPVAEAALLGDARALQFRVTRLLAPLPQDDISLARTGWRDSAAVAAVAILLCVALALGAAYGNAILHSFFSWTWNL